MGTEQIDLGGVTLNLETKPVEVNVEMDLSKVSWGDVRQFEDIPDKERAEFMTGLVTRVIGQDADELPPSVVTAIMERITGHINDTSDPND